MSSASALKENPGLKDDAHMMDIGMAADSTRNLGPKGDNTDRKTKLKGRRKILLC